MAIQEVKDGWIYLDRGTMIWQKNATAAQGVFQPIHWVALGRMQATLRLAPYEGRIADIGCGHGIVAVNMAWKKPRTEVIGVDPDEGRLEVGRQLLNEHGLPNCTFKRGTIEASGIEPGTCTGVVCTEVLDHIPDIKPVLKQKVDALMELLKPGGRLILSIFDTEGASEAGMAPPIALTLADFDFLKSKVIDRNCPRWWYLFYVDKR
ncbi:MAG: class I SAM-dependent methyltransferase [Planctomycetota bacterium]|nr:class I SAM-dependent methyltransferase [Planctomycetota bacterium]